MISFSVFSDGGF